MSAQEGIPSSDSGGGGDPERHRSDPAAGPGAGSPQAGGSHPQPSAAGGDQPGAPPGQTSAHRLGKRPGRGVIALAAAVAAMLLGGGILYAMVHGNTNQTVQASALTLPGRFRVTAVTPSSGSQETAGSDPVVVSFSAPLATGSPLPKMSPRVAGHWQREGNSLVFDPAAPISPSSQVTVTIPGGSKGVRSADGRHLRTASKLRFSTGSYSVLRLDQLLSKLGYLPVTWHASVLGIRSEDPLGDSASNSGPGLSSEEAMAYDPPAGVFSMAPGYPAQLAGMWQPDSDNTMVRGALMAFQSQHNMKLTGDATPDVWNALFQADLKGQMNTSGYTYALASKSGPESLTVWHNGQVVLNSPANTGLPVAPTADGTYPVYLRYLHQVMMGTNPDGSHYADPVSFVSYFNGGDAVHYFPRASFGTQQSLGCVELPFNAAQRSYPYLTYGSLVTVTG